MAASGKLKMPGPSIVFEESVIQRRKNGKFTSQTVQKMLKWNETGRKGRKRIFEERKEEREVGGSVSRKVRRLQSVGHISFCRTFK